jgi:uncharacterized protein (DUF1684 family)
VSLAVRLGALAFPVAALLMGTAARPSSPPASADAYRAEIEKWRARRIERLRSDTGWLTVVGLFWLEPGKNAVGSAPGNRVVLPAGKVSPYIGNLELSGGTVTFHASPGSGVASEGRPVTNLSLRSDVTGEPTVLSIGPVSFYTIQRGDRVGVRVKDIQSDARRDFHGIASFPIDARWRVEARFEAYRPVKRIPVPNVLGMEEPTDSPGALVFELDGKTYRLDPVLETGETDLFVIFGDRTNGRETYGAGRFLYAAPPVDGKTVLDFNKAYNPPCVFTPYATCPLPPAQNKLPIAIEAGEKRYGDH